MIENIDRRSYKGKNNPNWKGGLISVFCDNCGKIKKIKRKELKLKHHFCNRKCYSLWLKENMKGSKNPMYGVRLRGKKSGGYSNGSSTLKGLIRELIEAKQFKKEVFERDNYTCQDCGKRGGYLEIHHIKEFNNILKEFLAYYSQFSPIEDKETLVRLAITWKDFWDVNNGIVLCRNCHEKTFVGRAKNLVTTNINEL
ncbi:MAG: HNH endonuclease [Bacteroidales bacterium]|jgi:hypothetical protein|nr:HNH endonuclease [Bacteroidales bacterium]